jgi:hypothetical protein
MADGKRTRELLVSFPDGIDVQGMTEEDATYFFKRRRRREAYTCMPQRGNVSQPVKEKFSIVVPTSYGKR